MDKDPARSKRYHGILVDLYTLITHYRKSLADALVPPIPLSADDVARIRGWVCFLTAIALLHHRLPLAFGLLLFALILDSTDGVVARRRGLDCPQTDRAMDIFTEFMLYAAYLTSYPGWVSTVLMILWVVPKTIWIARYLKPRLIPDFKVSETGPWQYVSSSLIAFQSFLFAHTLLVLIFLQWVLRWDLP